MSDASETDELDQIREQKKAELRSEFADDAPSEPVHVEGADHFADLTGSGVVLVDFYADWCGPCKMLEPTVEALAAETDATVAKVDIDATQSLAEQFNVQGVPTLLLFVGGEPVERVVGVKDKESLLGLIERHT
jgi:thioredoxin